MSEEDAQLGSVREVTGRAIRRLGILESVLMVGAALVALVAGALAALLVAEVTGWPFRPTWIVASVVFFGVPGVVVIVRARREETGGGARSMMEPSTDE